MGDNLGVYNVEQGTATSHGVDNLDSDVPPVILHATGEFPSNTGITYWLSSTGGARWWMIRPGIPFVFPTPGSDLRWKVEMRSLSPVITPEIDEIQIVLADVDVDGVFDILETNTGVFIDENDTGTDPNNPDSDGDGFLDGDEIDNLITDGSADPNDSTITPADLDGDFVSDLNDSDDDNDGIPDEEDLGPAGEDFSRDTDNDGIDNESDPANEVFVDAENGSDETGTGTVDDPWQTITKATETVTGTPAILIDIIVRPGTYEERVVLGDYESLIGPDPASTTVQYFDALATENVVLESGDQSTIQNITITTPEPVIENVELLRIRNVSALVDNVIFDGKDNPNAFGVFVSRSQSSGTVVRNSMFTRVGSGVQSVETRAEFKSNMFEDIRQDAIFVRTPETLFQVEGEVDVPLFGDETIEGTGNNIFRRVEGSFIINNTGTTLKAENNDWGFDSFSDVDGKTTGPVDFCPFIGQTSNLVGVVTDADTGDPLTGATVTIEGADLATETLPDGGYVLANVPGGTQTVHVERAGYQSESYEITVECADTTTKSFELTPGEDGPVALNCPTSSSAAGTFLQNRLDSLRDFRDSNLLSNPFGRGFARAYYQIRYRD